MTRIEEFTVQEPPHLDVALGSGRLEVIAESHGRVRVSVDAADPDAFTIDQIGSTITIREESRWRSRRQRPRILVEAPPDADMTVRAGSADITTRGNLGVLMSRTGSGDLDVSAAARLDVSTGSGTIRVATAGGPARFDTASGDVSVGVIEGQLEASTASGDVEATSVAGSVEVGTASGDVAIGRVDGDAITIKTLSGDIRLGLPTGIRVEPDISTLSGSVTLPLAAPPSDDGPRRVVRVRLKTMSGDIRVDRST